MVCSVRSGVWKTADAIWEEDILHVRGAVGRGGNGAVVSFVNKKHIYLIACTNPRLGDCEPHLIPRHIFRDIPLFPRHMFPDTPFWML